MLDDSPPLPSGFAVLQGGQCQRLSHVELLHELHPTHELPSSHCGASWLVLLLDELRAVLVSRELPWINIIQ